MTWVFDRVPGEVASAVCANDHRVDHPLVYPAIVHAVIDSTSDPAAEPDSHTPIDYQPDLVLPAQHRLDSQLKKVGWKPHWLSWDSRAQVYHDWTEPGPVDWETTWPGLVATKATYDAVAEFARSSWADTSFGWIMNFGTTEPDLMRIEYAVTPRRRARIAATR